MKRQVVKHVRLKRSQKDAVATKKPTLINPKMLNDLVQNLRLTKDKAEILSLRLKH